MYVKIDTRHGFILVRMAQEKKEGLHETDVNSKYHFILAAPNNITVGVFDFLNHSFPVKLRALHHYYN